MYVSISSDDTRFSKGIAEARTKLEGLKDRMTAAEESSKKLAKGLAAIGAALLAAGAASFKLASDLNESMNKVDVAFKNSAGEVEAWSETTLENIGVAQGTALDMAAGFGDMATSMGISTDKAADMSTALVNLGGDMASFKNISVDIANTALTGVFTGETESLKQLGIVMTQANLQEYALSQGISKKLEAMNQAELVMLRYNYVLSVTENAQGDFARTHDEAANQMRIFAEGVKELAAAIGQHLVPLITPMIAKANEIIKQLIEMAELIGEEGIQGLLDQFSTSAKTVVVAIAGAITAALIPAFVALGTAIWAAMAPLLPFMAAGAAIAAVAYLIYEAWSSNMFGIQEKVAAVRDAIVAYFQMAVSEALLAFNALKAGVYGILESILNAVKPLVGVLGEIAPGFESAFGRAQTAISQKGDAASAEAKKQAEQFKKSATSLVQSAGQIKDAFSDWSTPAGSGDGLSFADFRSKFESPTDMGSNSDSTPGITSFEQFATAGANAASNLKEAWEITTESLKTRLSQVKTAFEITGNQLEMTGTQAQQLRNEMDSVTAQIEVQKQVVAAASAGYKQMKNEQGESSEEAENLKLKLLEEKKALSDLEKQLYETQTAIKEQTESMRNLADEITTVEKKYREDLADALDDYQKKVTEVYADLEEQEESLTEAYKEQLSERAKAIANFVGIFDEVTRESISGSTLLKNMQDQVDTITDWQSNLNALQARGIDSDLLAYLYELGPDAADELAALNTLTDDELSQYVTLWQEKNKLATSAAKTELRDAYNELQEALDDINQAAAEKLEQYRAEWEEKNAEIKKNVEETLSTIEAKMIETVGNSSTYGANIVTGLIEGLDSQFPALKSKAEEMADAIRDTFSGVMEISSPSKVMAKYGQFIVEGLTGGIQNNLSKLQSAVSGMARLTPEAVGASISNISSSSTVYDTGGNTFQIYLQGSSTRDQADILLRELRKRGVKF